MKEYVGTLYNTIQYYSFQHKKIMANQNNSKELPHQIIYAGRPNKPTKSKVCAPTAA